MVNAGGSCVAKIAAVVGGRNERPYSHLHRHFNSPVLECPRNDWGGSDEVGGMKYCSHCADVKPHAEFYPLRKGGLKLTNICRPCVRVKNHERYIKSRELV